MVIRETSTELDISGTPAKPRAFSDEDRHWTNRRHEQWDGNEYLVMDSWLQSISSS